MTISESIVKWLKRFEAEGIGKIESIDTDALKAIHASYGLMASPQKNVTKYVTGTEIHTEHFQFTARLSNALNSERIDNQAWFEALTDWIESQREKKDFPAMKEGCTCEDIKASSNYYMGMSDNQTAVYQMTISIKYRKEK